jgi:DNA-binding FadR family transcriptional regulator
VITEGDWSPPKYVQIVWAIRRQIAEGTYPDGSKLPSEPEMVAEFDASRGTVVRALEILQLHGIIKRVHGKGSFVQAASSRSRFAPQAHPNGFAVCDMATGREVFDPDTGDAFTFPTEHDAARAAQYMNAAVSIIPR